MKLVREHINEKFVDASDPIKDMNIGIGDWLGLEYGDIIYSEKDNTLLVVRDSYLDDSDNKMYITGVLFHHDRMLINCKDRYIDAFALSCLRDDYYSSAVLSKDLFYLIKNYKIKKYVGYFNKEKVNEAFSEESDPISDMGIGGYTFNTLKNGSIIKCIKSFGITTGGVIRSFNDAASRVTYGSYLMIYNIKKLDNYYISFKYRNTGCAYLPWRDVYKEDRIKKDAEYLNKAREFKKEYLSFSPESSPQAIYTYIFAGYIAKIGKNKFENMFKIIESNEHVN